MQAGNFQLRDNRQKTGLMKLKGQESDCFFAEILDEAKDVWTLDTCIGRGYSAVLS
jgi:hypothetical protein